MDLDGTFSYSPVRMVASGGKNGKVVAVYPNSATGAATLPGAAPGASVRVLDALGRVLGRATANATGAAALALLAGLPTGAKRQPDRSVAGAAVTRTSGPGSDAC